MPVLYRRYCMSSGRYLLPPIWVVLHRRGGWNRPYPMMKKGGGARIEPSIRSSLDNMLKVSPEYAFPDPERLCRGDFIIVFLICFTVLVSNVIYVSDLFMLWHDDNQSYYFSSLNQMSGRLSDVSRHTIVDSFLLHVMANVSPFFARVVTILIGALPLAILSYLVMRLALRLRPEAAAFGACGPLVVAGQWEIFVGINLSYVVFDASVFFLVVLLLVWARQASNWAVTLLVAPCVAIAISDGIVSSILLGPALLWCSFFIRPKSIWQSCIVSIVIVGGTVKSIFEQGSTGRAVFADEPVERIFRDLPATLDFLLPGGLMPAWIALALLAAFAIIGSLWSLRWRCSHPVFGIGLAAAMFLVPIIIYALFRPSFPNRYAFLPTIAVFILLAIGAHLVLNRVSRALGGTGIARANSWSLPSGVAGSILLLGLGGLAYHKSQYEEPRFTLMTNTARLVSDYFNPRENPIAGSVGVDTREQLILLSENGFPYMYPHRYPALGYIRFVTGDPTAVGFAGARKLCANPFEPWGGRWELGPGGFDEDQPISAHAFRGQNGRGAELKHLLATGATSLDAADASWTLYEIGDFGARALSRGVGRAELEARLAALEIEAGSVAFSCGL